MADELTEESFHKLLERTRYVLLQKIQMNPTHTQILEMTKSYEILTNLAYHQKPS